MIKTSRVRNIVLIDVPEHFITEDLIDIKNKISEMIDRDFQNFIINFHGHQGRIHASTLGILSEGLGYLRLTGGDVKLVAVDGLLRKMFESVGTAVMFEIYPDEKTALKSFDRVRETV